MKNSTGLSKNLKGKDRRALRVMAIKEMRRRNRERDPLYQLAMKYPTAKLRPMVDSRERLAKLLSVSPELLPKSKIKPLDEKKF